MLYNLTKTINWNDISDIDYTKGACNINTLKPLSEVMRQCFLLHVFNMERQQK